MGNACRHVLIDDRANVALIPVFISFAGWAARLMWAATQSFQRCVAVCADRWQPRTLLRLNKVGMRRRGYSQKRLILHPAFYLLLSARRTRLRRSREFGTRSNVPEVAELVRFIETSERA